MPERGAAVTAAGGGASRCGGRPGLAQLGHAGAARHAAGGRPGDRPEDRLVPRAARAVHVGRRARRDPGHRPGADLRAARARGAVRGVLPAHVVAAAAVAGLCLADLVRLEAGASWWLVPAGLLVLAAAPRPATLAVGALLVAAAGWWWGSARLDALDRSPLLAEVDRAARVTAVVTAEPRVGMFEQRIFARVSRFGTRRVDELVQLDLPLGRAPPQGARVSLLAVVRLPRGPSNGFDERTWLRRQGIHVVLKVDEWTVTGRRGRDRRSRRSCPALAARRLGTRARGRTTRARGRGAARRRQRALARPAERLPALGALSPAGRERPERRAARGRRARPRAPARGARGCGHISVRSPRSVPTCSRSGRSRP